MVKAPSLEAIPRYPPSASFKDRQRNSQRSPSSSSPLSQGLSRNDSTGSLRISEPVHFSKAFDASASLIPQNHATKASRAVSSPSFIQSDDSGNVKKTRRRSYAALPSPASPIASPLAAFVGSYENSLLSGRMSGPPSKPLPYLASVGVISKGDSKGKKRLKMPDHIHLGFDAHFYTHAVGSSESEQNLSTPSPHSSSPYVGSVDLEGFYLQQLNDTANTDIPKFPGYRIPQQGQLQIVIKNANRNPVRLFLVPYDLTDMPAGSKTFMRLKCYFDVADRSESSASASKGPLRYALQLQFCCPNLADGSDDSSSKRRIYLHKAMRVIFAYRAPDPEERLSTVYEWPSDSLAATVHHEQPQPNGWSTGRYTPYDGPSIEWISCRKARLKRDRLSSSRELEKLQSVNETFERMEMQATPSTFDDWPVRFSPYSLPNEALNPSRQQSLPAAQLFDDGSSNLFHRSSSGSGSEHGWNQDTLETASPQPISRQIGFEFGDVSPRNSPTLASIPLPAFSSSSPTSMLFTRLASPRPTSPSTTESGLSSSRPSSRLSDRPL